MEHRHTVSCRSFERRMTWRACIVAGGAAAVLCALALAGATTATANRTASLPVLATFAAKTQFPAGIAVGRNGDVYVSVTNWGKTENDPNTGRVWKITPGGGKTTVGPLLHLGGGLLTGVALDSLNRVYVAHATYDNATTPGIWRIVGGKAVRFVDLKVGAFPNEFAFHRGDLYVSDSALGAIWRIQGHHVTLWAKSALLAPGKRGLGANGIAFSRGRLYVAVTDAGRIVRFPLTVSGAAGKPTTIVATKKLVGADGMTVDANGTLYVVSDTNNLLLRLPAAGSLEQLANRANGLLYPTALAFGRRASDAGLLYIVNGDFFARARPNLVSFDLGTLAA